MEELITNTLVLKNVHTMDSLYKFVYTNTFQISINIYESTVETITVQYSTCQYNTVHVSTI